MNLSLEVRGLDEVRRKLDGAPVIVADELRTAMQQSVLVGQAVARERAAVDTGRMRASIATEVQGTLGELRGLIGTNVTPYPRILEESGRTHYRAGPRRGQPTAGWLSGTLPEIRERVIEFFRAAARRIAERLNR